MCVAPLAGLRGFDISGNSVWGSPVGVAIAANTVLPDRFVAWVPFRMSRPITPRNSMAADRG
jgi:hypothetical protein